MSAESMSDCPCGADVLEAHSPDCDELHVQSGQRQSLRQLPPDFLASRLRPRNWAMWPKWYQRAWERKHGGPSL